MADETVLFHFGSSIGLSVQLENNKNYRMNWDDQEFDSSYWEGIETTNWKINYENFENLAKLKKRFLCHFEISTGLSIQLKNNKKYRIKLNELRDQDNRLQNVRKFYYNQEEMGLIKWMGNETIIIRKTTSPWVDRTIGVCARPSPGWE